MCLSAEAFALFLNLLSPEIILAGPGQITIDATQRPAVWVQISDHWCTDAPEKDRLAQLK